MFAGEVTTRHFNFRHEWGMELIYYLVLSRTVPHLPADLLLRDDWLAVAAFRQSISGQPDRDDAGRFVGNGPRVSGYGL